MKRDVTYSLNQEFVYTGTRSTEVIGPGTLLVCKEKSSKELLRFYERLMVPTKDRDGTYLSNYISVSKESDLRTYPLVYLESDVVLSYFNFSGVSFHLFLYMGKELYLQQQFRFFKPLFFDGHSL